MKKLIIGLVCLFPTVANATAIVCLFEKTKERFNIVSMTNGDYIQWSGGNWVAVVTDYKDGYLTLAQYADTATFKMVLNSKDFRGYGSMSKYSGEKIEGPILCAVD